MKIAKLLSDKVHTVYLKQLRTIKMRSSSVFYSQFNLSIEIKGKIRPIIHNLIKLRKALKCPET